MIPAPQVMITGHDSSKFSETMVSNPSIDFESEGGWSITRARFTRRPPVVYTLGFTDISDTEKKHLQQVFFDAGGSSEIITGWTHPITGLSINVRFKKNSIPQFIYKGFGENHRWNVSNFMIEEV